MSKGNTRLLKNDNVFCLIKLKVIWMMDAISTLEKLIAC